MVGQSLDRNNESPLADGAHNFTPRQRMRLAPAPSPIQPSSASPQPSHSAPTPIAEASIIATASRMRYLDRGSRSTAPETQNIEGCLQAQINRLQDVLEHHSTTYGLPEIEDLKGLRSGVDLGDYLDIFVASAEFGHFWKVMVGAADWGSQDCILWVGIPDQGFGWDWLISE